MSVSPGFLDWTAYLPRLTHEVQNNKVVITGLVPVIHVLLSFCRSQDVDGRVKPGHDEEVLSVRPGVA
jgi:hypothetical protein